MILPCIFPYQIVSIAIVRFKQKYSHIICILKCMRLQETKKIDIVKVTGLSLHPGKPVLASEHITPWSMGLFIPLPSDAVLDCSALAHD